MIYYLKGIIAELTPTFAIIEVNGVGYYINISLQTSQALIGKKDTYIYIQQIIREDAHLLYGFSTKDERDLFNLLISVNGVGAVSCLLLLSSLSNEEISSAILSGNSVQLQKAKGIGAKTAQRIIVDLKDKVAKFNLSGENISSFADNKVKEESLTALEVLGITRRMSEKLADRILKNTPDLTVEALTKEILKSL